jgi:hypothetical protein
MQHEPNIPQSLLDKEEDAMSNEHESTLFEPEVILPGQLSLGARCDGSTSGARALMSAVLADAMLCIERGRRRRHHRTRQLAAEAETWMRSDCRDWLYSFANICDVLGIDADALRARLQIDVAVPAESGRASRPELDAPSTRSGAGVRPLPRREGTRELIAVDAARAPVQCAVRGRQTASGFAAHAELEVA